MFKLPLKEPPQSTTNSDAEDLVFQVSTFTRSLDLEITLQAGLFNQAKQRLILVIDRKFSPTMFQFFLALREVHELITHERQLLTKFRQKLEMGKHLANAARLKCFEPNELALLECRKPWLNASRLIFEGNMTVAIIESYFRQQEIGCLVVTGRVDVPTLIALFVGLRDTGILRLVFQYDPSFPLSDNFMPTTDQVAQLRKFLALTSLETIDLSEWPVSSALISILSLTLLVNRQINLILPTLDNTADEIEHANWSEMIRKISLPEKAKVNIVFNKALYPREARVFFQRWQTPDFALHCVSFHQVTHSLISNGITPAMQEFQPNITKLALYSELTESALVDGLIQSRQYPSLKHIELHGKATATDEDLKLSEEKAQQVEYAISNNSIKLFVLNFVFSALLLLRVVEGLKKRASRETICLELHTNLEINESYRDNVILILLDAYNHAIKIEINGEKDFLTFLKHIAAHNRKILSCLKESAIQAINKILGQVERIEADSQIFDSLKNKLIQANAYPDRIAAVEAMKKKLDDNMPELRALSQNTSHISQEIVALYAKAMVDTESTSVLSLCVEIKSLIEAKNTMQKNVGILHRLLSASEVIAKTIVPLPDIVTPTNLASNHLLLSELEGASEQNKETTNLTSSSLKRVKSPEPRPRAFFRNVTATGFPLAIQFRRRPVQMRTNAPVRIPEKELVDATEDNVNNTKPTPTHQ